MYSVLRTSHLHFPRGNNNYIAIRLQAFFPLFPFSLFSFPPRFPCRGLASICRNSATPSALSLHHHSARRNLRSRDLVAGARSLLKKKKKTATTLWRAKGRTSIPGLDQRSSRWRPFRLAHCLAGPRLRSCKPCRIPSQDGRSSSAAAATDRAHLSTKLDVYFCICQCAAAARHCLPCSKQRDR